MPILIPYFPRLPSLYATSYVEIGDVIDGISVVNVGPKVVGDKQHKGRITSPVPR